MSEGIEAFWHDIPGPVPVEIVVDDQVRVSEEELDRLSILAREMGGQSEELLAELEQAQPQDAAS